MAVCPAINQKGMKLISIRPRVNLRPSRTGLDDWQTKSGQDARALRDEIPSLALVSDSNPANKDAGDLLAMSGIILCGGKSKRMGRPKAFLPYAGKTLIEHSLDRMSEVFSEVILVSNNPDDFEHLSASVVRDIIPHRGPLVGILSGLLVANFEHAFVMPCDMPLVSVSLMKAMSAARHNSATTVYRQAGRPEPLLAVYCRSCIEPLEERIFRGLDAAIDFVDGTAACYFDAEAQSDLLPAHFNVDTPSDYSILCGS